MRDLPDSFLVNEWRFLVIWHQKFIRRETGREHGRLRRFVVDLHVLAFDLRIDVERRPCRIRWRRVVVHARSLGFAQWILIGQVRAR